jgi:eukaryotic-like serine/threonine-protein kinase
VSLSIILQSGDNLYKYQLNRKIGGGNFGEVWLAHDVTISKDIAVKILDESMAPVAENLKEAQVGNRLDHNNVVHVHYADIVEVSGNNLVIIAMDYHPTGSVVGQLNSSNFLSIKSALLLIIDVLRGLEYLHEQDLYHNDIKPSNILIGPRGEGVLTDYGISCVSVNMQPIQAPNAYILHRAPETTASNNISVQTDIYQVGLTLFRLINGVGLIRDIQQSVGNVQFEVLKSQNKIPDNKQYLPFVPQRIKKIIKTATDSNSNNRYQSALEMRRALEAVAVFGYWSTDATGSYLGYFNDQMFRFGITKNVNGLTFTPYRKRLSTNKETRVAKLAAKNLSQKECNKAIQKFMLSVIDGNI